jgi:putative restriction endonuclease
MKIYVGITDNDWYNFLAKERPDEVNFWTPNGNRAFRALEPNELFLFKLHSPLNYIVGGGFFVRHTLLPLSLAWEAFEQKNGTPDYLSFRNAICKYRKSDYRTDPDPEIGCIILSSPFFFDRDQWLPVPEDWRANIVQGKTYDTETTAGRQLYDRVMRVLFEHNLYQSELAAERPENRYGPGYVVHPRIGQGTFKVMVTEAYHRRCAITGEKTLPVLEAAHIKPFAQNGPHLVSNGLLLRRDIHALFDRGYITVNEEYRIEVSKRIKEDYGNGREYYAYHGKRLAEIPDRPEERPSKQFLLWHNENVFLA